MKSQIAILLCAVVVICNAMSECEEARASALNGVMIGAFLPQCDEDGHYSAMQCHGSTGMCWCARKDGTHITEPERGMYEDCTCVRHKAEAQANGGLIGAFIPACEENGHYSTKQCWGSTGTCWCVDKNGEKITEPERGDVQCN